MTRLLVVSDSCSLILLTKANLLEKIVGEFNIEIPQKVFDETITQGKLFGKLDAYKIEEFVLNKKIIVKKISSNISKEFEKICKEINLGDGEKEAILLYLQTKAKLLLVDDKQAITSAELLHINWTGVLGLISLLFNEKKLTRYEANEALRIFQNEGRYKLDLILEVFDLINRGDM
jgi:predicted nucleic acid-binding protein